MAGFGASETLGTSAFSRLSSPLEFLKFIQGALMPTESSGDYTEEERVLFGAYNVAADLAAGCRRLREMDVSVSATALEIVVNALMTEFWDQGFSQTEIRGAFVAALDDMNRYAAGSERR
jgi:hypothetical protein